MDRLYSLERWLVLRNWGRAAFVVLVLSNLIWRLRCHPLRGHIWKENVFGSDYAAAKCMRGCAGISFYDDDDKPIGPVL